MTTKLLDYIDFESVNSLLEGFNQSTGFVTAILDLEGNILSKSGWRQICTEFHRVNPVTAMKCKISDTILANKMNQGETYHYYQCTNGLVDVAVPIIVKGEHIANLFSGQFFFEEPDIEFFRKQAHTYGFDEESYLEALRKVSIVSKDNVEPAMGFLKSITQMIAMLTLEKIELIEQMKARKHAEEALRLSEEQFRLVAENLLNAYDATIEGWGYAVELRDMTTENHSRRVVDLTLQLTITLGVNENDLVHVRRGALLHDIGKMGIPDSILQKPDKLNEDEWEIMRKHPVYAYDMLSRIQYLKQALDIPYCHHEKWDGSGYPQGLKGDEIPLAARIFAVADVYDALTNDRPYRKAWTREEALEYIRMQSGTHFDPDVVAAFMAEIQIIDHT